jgi:hypothetical protein
MVCSGIHPQLQFHLSILGLDGYQKKDFLPLFILVLGKTSPFLLPFLQEITTVGLT